MMRGLVVVVGLVVAGCYSAQPATGLPCAENGACPDGLECRTGRCEKPGSDVIDGSFDVPVDVAIDACASATCSGNDIVGCGESVTCQTACSSIGGAHCMVLVPSNGLSGTLLQGATADVTSNQDWTFDTDVGQIKKGNIFLRNPGTGVISGIRFQVIDGMGVFSARSFTITAGSVFGAVGSNTLALYATTTIQISGELSVSASSDAGGPGGSSSNLSTITGGCRGRAGRNLGATYAEGGGGGGGVTAGGIGGPSNNGPGTGLGGTVCTSAPSTIPLRGGNAGGAGGQSSSNWGGGGGGGVALVAMESITVSGVVTAPGAGGASNQDNGGGGGGGGGAIFLEAPTVTVTAAGAVTANGGSGAAPSIGDGLPGSRTSSNPVLGGAYACPIVGGTARGGSGGTRLAPPTSGGNCTYDDGLGTAGSRGGGGGGAVGKIEMKALMSTTTGAVLSPTPLQTTPMFE